MYSITAIRYRITNLPVARFSYDFQCGSKRSQYLYYFTFLSNYTSYCTAVGIRFWKANACGPTIYYCSTENDKPNDHNIGEKKNPNEHTKTFSVSGARSGPRGFRRETVTQQITCIYSPWSFLIFLTFPWDTWFCATLNNNFQFTNVVFNAAYPYGNTQ